MGMPPGMQSGMQNTGMMGGGRPTPGIGGGMDMMRRPTPEERARRTMAPPGGMMPGGPGGSVGLPYDGGGRPPMMAQPYGRGTEFGGMPQTGGPQPMPQGPPQFGGGMGYGGGGFGMGGLPPQFLAQLFGGQQMGGGYPPQNFPPFGGTWR